MIFDNQGKLFFIILQLLFVDVLNIKQDVVIFLFASFGEQPLFTTQVLSLIGLLPCLDLLLASGVALSERPELFFDNGRSLNLVVFELQD